MTDFFDPEFYSDPEVEYTEELVHCALRNVCRGDSLNAMYVGSVKTGTKWTEVRAQESGTLILRDLNDTQVTVYRQKYTAEYRDAVREYDRNIRLIQNTLEDRSLTKLQRAGKKLAEDLEDEHIGYGTIEDLITTNAERQVRRDWLAAVEWARNPANEKPWQGTAGELFDAYLEDLKERLVARSTYNVSTSRSTNMVSNLMDDAEREAMAKFINDAKWWLR